ncbi:MAG: hypothetical protein ACOX57_05695 [Limnochordia bacterium]
MHYPDFAHAKALALAGAEIVAVDVRWNRPLENLWKSFCQRSGRTWCCRLADARPLMTPKMHKELGRRCGANLWLWTNSIGTHPDFALLEEMIKLGLPVIAEGGFWEPQQVVQAFELGSWSVVVGSAITRPLEITKRFVQALKAAKIAPDVARTTRP